MAADDTYDPAGRMLEKLAADLARPWPPAPADGVYRFRQGDQPLPVPNDGPSMHDLAAVDIQLAYPGCIEVPLVCADLDARKQLGLKRYGSLLQANNRRDALRDLYEELLDAAVYARQKLTECELAGQAPDYRLAIAYQALLRHLLAVRSMTDVQLAGTGDPIADDGPPASADVADRPGEASASADGPEVHVDWRMTPVEWEQLRAALAFSPYPYVARLRAEGKLGQSPERPQFDLGTVSADDDQVSVSLEDLRGCLAWVRTYLPDAWHADPVVKRLAAVAWAERDV